MSVNKTISMVNISEEPLTIMIGAGPGEGVTEYVIKPGESQAFHENYCKPVPGAGHQELPSILSRQSTRTFPDGVRRPCLVPADEVRKVSEQYKAELDAWKKAGSRPKVSQPEPPAR